MTFTDSQYDELMSTYYQTQIENKIALEDRKQEIYEKIPRIQEIDETIANSSIEAMRANLQHDTDTRNAIKEQNHVLISEKENLLIANDYPPDYLQPIYTCPLCKDTGRIGSEYCSCFQQAAISLLYRQSNLEQILEIENFDHFNLNINYYPQKKMEPDKPSPYENMSNILNKAKDFVDSFGTIYVNLLFYGETGLGKTFLSHCIAKALLDKRHTVLYLSSIHLFEDVCGDVIMNKGQNPGSQETYRYLYSCDLLIIDDLGTEYTNSFVSSELYNILNTRMRKKKPTLISTNLNLKELTDRYTDRITTRIMAEYEVCNFYGNNIRLVKRTQQLKNNI